MFRGSKRELLEAIRQLPAVLAGKAPDPTGGGAKDLLIGMGLALLGQVQEAFVKKSEGGTDDMGIRWPPLAPATLALRRKGSGGKLAARLAAEAKKLPSHRRRLVAIHYQRLLALYQAGARGDVAAGMARRHALRILEWTKDTMAAGRYQRLKRQLSKDMPAGRATKEAILGAYALILRDTGRLLNSLSPEIGAGGTDRLLEARPGSVTIGSNVRTASGYNLLALHNSGRPRKQKADGTDRLPRRQILPDNQKQVPAHWWRAAGLAVRDGLPRYLERLAQTAGR